MKIARCESGLNPNAKNPASTASGIMQFLDSTYARYAKLYAITAPKSDPQAQLEMATRIISEKGTKDWAASASCWE